VFGGEKPEDVTFVDDNGDRWYTKENDVEIKW